MGWQKYSSHVRTMRKENARSYRNLGSVFPLLGCNTSAMQHNMAKLRMDMSLSDDVNEQLLFHGTSYDDADLIVKSGFDFRKSKCGSMAMGHTSRPKLVKLTSTHAGTTAKQLAVAEANGHLLLQE